MNMPTPPFASKARSYGSTFFMATGFHGFHVIVGTIFLTVCLMRGFCRAIYAKAASGFRIRGLVLAFRRRGLAVSVRLHLCVGFLGRDFRADEFSAREWRPARTWFGPLCYVARRAKLLGLKMSSGPFPTRAPSAVNVRVAARANYLTVFFSSRLAATIAASISNSPILAMVPRFSYSAGGFSCPRRRALDGIDL